MPAVVSGHEMRRTPVLARRLEKGDAFIMAVRGLHHVSERMGRPGVAGVHGQGLPAEVLGALEIARLLEPEGVEAEDEASCQRIVAVPRRQHPRRGVADGDRPAEEEIGVLRQPQCERVGRMIGKDLFPVRGSLSRSCLPAQALAASKWRRSRSEAR